MEQLYKKQNGQYIKVYPLNYIENILDSESGKTLASILSNFNNISLPYQDNAQDTRALVPQVLRRKGLWITYNNGEDYVTEYYKGDANDIQEYWVEDYNWEIVPNLKYVQDNASKLPDGIITADKLSPALLQLIQSNGKVVNMADDEDIEEVNSTLKFKDRKYNSELASGKGYKILRKNWTKVGDKMINLLTQDMINEANTIYEIRYDFDLNEKDIIIPEGCLLKFESGSFNNGSITPNECFIVSSPTFILNVNINGKLGNSNYYIEWFGEVNNTDCTTAFQKAIDIISNSGGGIINLLKYTYYISTITINWKVSIKGSGILSTIIKKNNSEGNVINITPLACGITICDLTIDGSSKGGDCINVSDNQSINTYYDPFNQYPTDNAKTQYKYLYVNRVMIKYAGNNGITLNPVTFATFLKDIHIYQSAVDGLYCATSDNMFDTLYLEQNGRCGFYEHNGANKVSNVKIIWNGHKDDSLAALYIDGSNDMFTNIECQDNFCTPVYISSNNNLFTKLNLNTNGYDKDKYYETGDHVSSGKAVGIHITGNNNKLEEISFSTYRWQTDGLLKCFYIDEGYGNEFIVSPGADFPSQHRPYTSNYVQEHSVGVSKIGKSNLYKSYRIVDNRLYTGYFKNTIIQDEINILVDFELTDINNLNIIELANLKWSVQIANYKQLYIVHNLFTSTPISSGPLVNGKLIQDYSNYWGDIVVGKKYRLTGTIRCIGTRAICIYYISEIVNDKIRVHSYSIAYEFDENVHLRFDEDIRLRQDKITQILIDDSINFDSFYILDEPIKGITPKYHYNESSAIVITDDITFGKDNSKKLSYKDSLPNDGKMGQIIYNIDDSVPMWWDGVRWRNAKGQTVNINFGTTENRPNNFTVLDRGFEYFDTTINAPIWWNGTKWVDSEGNDADFTPITSGTFANKPTGVDIGYAYFCTDKQTSEGSTNGIMIYHKGDNVWVDALGRVVS